MRKINYVQILFLATRHVSNRPRNPKRDRSTSRRFASNLFRARNVHQSSAPLYFAIFKSARPAARHLLKLVSRRQYRKNKLLADYYFTLHPRLIKRRMEMTSLSLSLFLYLAWVSLFYESFYLWNVQHHQGGLGHLVVWRVLAYNEIEIVQSLERYRATGVHAKRGSNEKNCTGRRECNWDSYKSRSGTIVFLATVYLQCISVSAAAAYVSLIKPLRSTIPPSPLRFFPILFSDYPPVRFFLLVFFVSTEQGLSAYTGPTVHQYVSPGPLQAALDRLVMLQDRNWPFVPSSGLIKKFLY